MDLSKFTSKTKTASGTVQSQGFVKKNYNKVKNWILPPTSDQRKQRIDQYKDLGLFLAAVAAVAIFEDKIKSFL
jgi:hypothetical protein